MAYSSLHDRLRRDIAKKLLQERKIQNLHALPKVKHVIVSTGINAGKSQGKDMQEYIVEALAKITGQRPVFTKSRKAIANFKIRKGTTVGAMVTLRGKRMEAFLDRLVSYTLPRIRDFRGLHPRFDGHGNYSLGINDHSVFPEIPPPDVGKIFGLQVQVTTTARRDEDARALLEAIGFPFRKERETPQRKSTPAVVSPSKDSDTLLSRS